MFADVAQLRRAVRPSRTADVLAVHVSDLHFGHGDAPATGEAEYTLAADWPRQIQQALEVSDARVCMVLGNHVAPAGPSISDYVRATSELVFRCQRHSHRMQSSRKGHE